MVPCLIREDFVCDEVDGQMYTYCSEGCRWTHKVAFAAEYEGRPTPAMGRFSGRREWEDCYHGWDVADAIKDLGFVRDDGKTLVPQPHLRFDTKDMWTLDDVRGHTLGSPLRGFRALKPGAERDAAVAEYRKGFKITPCH
jgi:propane monooxygenase large subunit